MSPDELKALRKKLDMTQQELATALNVSFPTLNRWESKEETHRPIPPETEKLLECLAELLRNAEKTKAKVTIDDIRQALKNESIGISGIVAAAVQAGLIPSTFIASLALWSPLGWLGAIAGVVAHSIFGKLEQKEQKPIPKGGGKQ